MSLATLRSSLHSALANTGLQGYEFEPDAIQPAPVCWVIGGSQVNYNDDFDGDYTVSFAVLLLTNRSSGTAYAMQELEPYADPGVATSLPAVVKAHMPSANVTQAGEWGDYMFGETPYFGVRFDVQVLSS